MVASVCARWGRRRWRARCPLRPRLSSGRRRGGLRRRLRRKRVAVLCLAGRRPQLRRRVHHTAGGRVRSSEDASPFLGGVQGSLQHGSGGRRENTREPSRETETGQGAGVASTWRAERLPRRGARREGETDPRTEEETSGRGPPRGDQEGRGGLGERPRAAGRPDDTEVGTGPGQEPPPASARREPPCASARRAVAGHVF
uniref:Uncharacterized protein n=1 Tax=Rousettus aegyptiacus TaxID=9407 RepID=A0A7J8GBI6_ROUAE|nr:hypothetical protein HJG63_012693 [Rousettus aegyptiacus]